MLLVLEESVRGMFSPLLLAVFYSIISISGAGAGGVAGLGSGVAKGGFWPMLPQQQVAMKRSRVDEAGAHHASHYGPPVHESSASVHVVPTGTGIVSASTMQYLSELKAKRQSTAVVIGQKRKVAGVLTADYGSDSE
ncbi:hypothetical protein BDR26DRAFT_622944 [Obelidium mucronatum]|nr:hypothetical protein BDR26DRAFT_622944 [Obelidium mucronatum]